MYEEHPSFIDPKEGDSAIIWRYMDFTKFVLLLDKKALFFSCIDNFEDPWEGLYSQPTFKAMKNTLSQFSPDNIVKDTITLGVNY